MDSDVVPEKWGRRFGYVLLFVCVTAIGVALFLALWSKHWAIDILTLTLAALFAAVCLSPSFDNFQIGKLIAISREKRVAVKQATDAQQLNERLLAQLLQVTTAVSSSQQVHQNIQIGTPTVAKVSAEEKAAASNDAVEDLVTPTAPSENAQQVIAPEMGALSRAALEIEDARKIEAVALSKYLARRQSSIQFSLKDVKITGISDVTDPIATREIIFDAYIREDASESFVEIILQKSMSLFRLDHIYVQIARVYFYKLARNVNASMVILIVDYPSSDTLLSTSRRRSVGDRITERFVPAIMSGLLRLEHVEVSEDDLQQPIPQLN